MRPILFHKGTGAPPHLSLMGSQCSKTTQAEFARRHNHQPPPRVGYTTCRPLDLGQLDDPRTRCQRTGDWHWLRSTEASDKHALETLRGGGRTRPSQVWLGPRQKLHGENVCRMTTSISRIKTLRVYQRQLPCSCRAWPGVIDSDKGSIHLSLTFLLVQLCWRATLSSEH